MAFYQYEGPSPSREQCPYFKGELVGLREFWSRWDATGKQLDESVFAGICDELSIPMPVRAALWFEVVTD